MGTAIYVRKNGALIKETPFKSRSEACKFLREDTKCLKIVNSTIKPLLDNPRASYKAFGNEYTFHSDFFKV